jgi:hypothetical protein
LRPEDTRAASSIRAAIHVRIDAIEPCCERADILRPARLPARNGHHRKGRLALPLSFAEWLRRAADPRILTLAPLDVSVVTALDDLPGSFHGDPADRVIVATSRVHAWPLATHDGAIRRSRAARLWKPAPA